MGTRLKLPRHRPAGTSGRGAGPHRHRAALRPAGRGAEGGGRPGLPALRTGPAGTENQTVEVAVYPVRRPAAGGCAGLWLWMGSGQHRVAAPAGDGLHPYRAGGGAKRHCRPAHSPQRAGFSAHVPGCTGGRHGRGGIPGGAVVQRRDTGPGAGAELAPGDPVRPGDWAGQFPPPAGDLPPDLSGRRRFAVQA